MPSRLASGIRALVLVALLALAAAAPSASAATQPGPGERSRAVERAPAADLHARVGAWRQARLASRADALAHARLLACRRSPLLDGRVALVGAWMRPLPGATRLALRIDLLERLPGSRRWTRRSDVPGLGAWTEPSDALVGTRAGDVFKYRQSVGRLAVRAAYRFRVAFRWLDAAGAVVREAAVTTRPCRQPDLRPELVLDEVRAVPTFRDPSLVRYAVLVRNAGRSTAARVAVAATLPGDTTPRSHVRGVRRLGPGQRAVVTFTGPGCAAGEAPALFVADPANAIDEADEANNELLAACPAP